MLSRAISEIELEARRQGYLLNCSASRFPSLLRMEMLGIAGRLVDLWHPQAKDALDQNDEALDLHAWETLRGSRMDYVRYLAGMRRGA
jgi:hypothetical protein